MALNQTNKITWLIKTILDTGKITFEEINRKWMANEDMSGGKELLKRTFHKWKDAVLDTYGLVIENENKGEYRYYIMNADELDRNSISKWMLDTYSVANSLENCKRIKNRIILEEVPSGQEYLDFIILAMKENRMIHIVYFNYWREDERNYTIEPYFIKLFKQRWYVIGNLVKLNKVLVFSLDRIHDLRISKHLTFKYPTDFSPEEYFKNCYGVIADENIEIETVRIKVSEHQANYIRDLKLHDSQIEIEHNDEYSIFELQIRPTFDFQQEILSNGEDIEVLKPIWLRNEIANKVKNMLDKYNKILK